MSSPLVPRCLWDTGDRVQGQLPSSPCDLRRVTPPLPALATLTPAPTPLSPRASRPGVRTLAFPGAESPAHIRLPSLDPSRNTDSESTWGQAPETTL